MKNTVYALARELPFGSSEELCRLLGRHFLATQPQVAQGARSAPAKGRGSATPKSGRPSSAAARSGPPSPTRSSASGEDFRETMQASGISQPADPQDLAAPASRTSPRPLHHLEGNRRPPARHPARGRPGPTTAPARRRSTSWPPGCGSTRPCCKAFADHESRSVQETLKTMGEAALAAAPEIDRDPPGDAQQTLPAGQPRALRPRQPQPDLPADRRARRPHRRQAASAARTRPELRRRRHLGDMVAPQSADIVRRLRRTEHGALDRGGFRRTQCGAQGFAGFGAHGGAGPGGGGLRGGAAGHRRRRLLGAAGAGRGGPGRPARAAWRRWAGSAGYLAGSDRLGVDCIFPIVHGTWGEDGTLQGPLRNGRPALRRPGSAGERGGLRQGGVQTRAAGGGGAGGRLGAGRPASWPTWTRSKPGSGVCPCRYSSSRAPAARASG